MISYLNAFNTFSNKGFLQRSNGLEILGPLLLKDPTVLQMLVEISRDEHGVPAGLQLPQFIHLLEVLFGGVVFGGLQEFSDDLVILDPVGLHVMPQVVPVSVSEEHKDVLFLVGLLLFERVQPRPVVFAPSWSDYWSDLVSLRIWFCFNWWSDGNICSWREFRVELIVVVDLRQWVNLFANENLHQILGIGHRGSLFWEQKEVSFLWLHQIPDLRFRVSGFGEEQQASFLGLPVVQPDDF